MKIGRSLVELSAEIERRAHAKRDLVAPVETLETVVEEAQGKPGLRLMLANERKETFGVTPHAHSQIADYLGIPLGDYRRMQVETPAFLARVVNRAMKNKGKDARTLRTLDGVVRGFLTARYRTLEIEDVAEAVVPLLKERKLVVVSCEVTDERLYIKAVDRNIERDIPKGRALGDGTHTGFDTISPGLVISYSEVGAGSLSVETSIWTLVCTNLAVVEAPLRRHLLSGRRALSGEDYVLACRETKDLTAAAIHGPIRDLVTSALDEAKFEAAVRMLTLAARRPMESTNVVEMVERVGERFGLDEGEKKLVLEQLIENGDFTYYGLHAAITRASADVGNYDRATELERLGGRVIDLPPLEWDVLPEARPSTPRATLKAAS